MKSILFAIAGCEAAEIDTAGFDGGALRPLGTGAPVAVLAARPGPPGTGLEELRAHERTVAALMDQHPVLPARFGTLVSDAEAGRLLEQHRDALRVALERVRGAVELGVHARATDGDDASASSREPAAPGDAEAPPRPGTAYLEARLRQTRRLQALRAKLSPLEGLARAVTDLAGEHGDDRLRRAYLVERSRVDMFLDAVRTIDAAGHVELVCTGPWPPYSFSGDWS